MRQKFQTNEKPRPRLAAVNFLFKPSGHLRRRHRFIGAQQGRPQPAPARARLDPFSFGTGVPWWRLLRLQNKEGSALKSPADIFFHVSALQEGDEITEGKAVSFETGPDLKTGKIKAISVDLT